MKAWSPLCQVMGFVFGKLQSTQVGYAHGALTAGLPLFNFSYLEFSKNDKVWYQDNS